MIDSETSRMARYVRIAVIVDGYLYCECGECLGYDDLGQGYSSAHLQEAREFVANKAIENGWSTKDGKVLCAKCVEKKVGEEVPSGS